MSWWSSGAMARLSQRIQSCEFRLRLTLNLRPEDRQVLEAYPGQPLWPDFAVLAAGWAALELGGRPLMYRGGVLLQPSARPPVQDPLDLPESHIGDYIALFAQRLLDAAIRVSTESEALEHLANFADNPGCLALRRSGDRVRVAYRESPSGADVAVAHPGRRDFRETLAGAVEGYVAQVLAVNPALGAQPDVVKLRTGVFALLRVV